MAKPKHISLSRLREILRRQDPPKWGQDYDPAIRATREEGPTRSRPAQVWNDKLGRYCHALSSVEQKALLVAMFNPSLFEIHEQRMLATEARPHPLTGHELSTGMSLCPLRGTIDVCERLDAINHHHWVYIDHPDGTGRVPVPFPFIGDFLLFLTDEGGPYCVNWTIKGSNEEFSERLILADRPSRAPAKECAAVEMRHAIEERYYLDAGISTIRIVDRDLPDMFVQNIRSLMLMMHRAPVLKAEIYCELCERLQASTRTAQRPLDILLSMVHRYNLSLEVLRSAFGRALWQRDVRAELMSEAIFIDHPLRAEHRDPLEIFASWFSRPAI
jgi:hypothetical protein